MKNVVGHVSICVVALLAFSLCNATSSKSVTARVAKHKEEINVQREKVSKGEFSTLKNVRSDCCETAC